MWETPAERSVRKGYFQKHSFDSNFPEELRLLREVRDELTLKMFSYYYAYCDPKCDLQKNLHSLAHLH